MFPRWVWLGAALVAASGFFNLGIIAIDDYNNGFAIMVPSQRAPSFWALFAQDLFPVLPKVFLSSLATCFRFLGASHPVTQLRWSLMTLGLVCFAANLFSARRLFEKSLPLEKTVAYFLVCFYFALPLFSTRPMNETLCMPLLTLSGVFAALYAQQGSKRALIQALLLLTAAACMRFQAGVCWLALAFLVAYRRSVPDAKVLGVWRAGAFFVSGLPDWFYTGRFHSHLRQYLDYNLQHSAEHYGAMPATVFHFLAIALTLPPTFFSFYRHWDARRAYAPLTAPVLYVLLFLIAHSLPAHKEERFFIPILPLFLFCLVPAAAWLWRNGGSWRRVWFLGVNTVLLVLACTNVPQANLLGLAAWVDSHPSIEAVEALEQSVVFPPQAFISRPVVWHGGKREGYQNDQCNRLTVLRLDKLPWEQNEFREVARFEPGWLERVLVRLNPKNARRGALVAFLPHPCREPISE